MNILFQQDNVISTRTNFNVDSDAAGREVWLDLTEDGRLTGIMSVKSDLM